MCLEFSAGHQIKVAAKPKRYLTVTEIGLWGWVRRQGRSWEVDYSYTLQVVRQRKVSRKKKREREKTNTVY